MRTLPLRIRSLARTSALVGAVLTAAASCSAAPDPLGPGPEGAEGPTPEDFAVLFVGNSLTYTNSLPAMVATLLDHAGVGPLFIASSAFPNYGLQDHWVNSSTRGIIAAGGWDFVVMQQGPSATEGRPSLLQYGALFASEIRGIGAEPVFYSVWPAEERDFDFPGVSESYSMAAEASGATLFPAGDAWLAAWEIDETLPLYGPDGFHPSRLGTYLAAAVAYEVLTDSPARDLALSLPRDLGLLTDRDAVIQVLHEAASSAVDAHR